MKVSVVKVRESGGWAVTPKARCCEADGKTACLNSGAFYVIRRLLGGMMKQIGPGGHAIALSSQLLTLPAWPKGVSGPGPTGTEVSNAD